jgi:hypothetical protein
MAGSDGKLAQFRMRWSSCSFMADNQYLPAARHRHRSLVIYRHEYDVTLP